MNNDLISREALKKKFKDESYWTYTHEYGDAIPIGWILSAIDNAPTVDIPNYGGQVVPDMLQGWRYEERQQGEWLHPYKTNIACECSVCNMQMPITDYFNFCPNCGARMKGGAE